jgi:CRISPR/Cas system CSM-associated protein Csm2 small subunit
MASNLSHAQSSQRHEGVLQIDIRVQGPESEGSESYCSDDSASTSTTSSNSIKINLTVEHQSERYVSHVTIDTSEDNSFNDVCDELDLLRPEGSCTDDKAIERYYILSGNLQTEVKSPFRVPSHLETAAKLYQSRTFSRFEILETISSKETKNSTTVLQTVQNKLSNAKIQCKPESQDDFIPETTLREIMSEETLRQLFKEDEDLSNLSDFETVLDEICANGYKLLATILLAGIKPMGKTLLGFKEASILDFSMPFQRKPRFPLGFVTPCDYHNIFKNQWSTIAFVFNPYDDTAKKKKILDKEMVIPLLEMVELHCGGFGEVYKIKIHPDHQNLSSVEEVSHSF